MPRRVSPKGYNIRESLFPNKKRKHRDSTERFETVKKKSVFDKW